MKDILLKLITELEDLKANQALLAARVGTGVTISEARDAKASVLKANRATFDALRAKVEAL